MNQEKETFGISEKSFNIIIDTLKRFSEIKKAVIFGSRALGNAKPGSDIDIALIGEDLTDDILREITIILNEKENIPYFVDIVVVDKIENKELHEHIAEFGRELFSEPPRRSDQ
jgi:predicted nucleotidyltransferase